MEVGAIESRLRVATFNLFNLVLPETPYHGHHVCSPDSYRRKIDWIARQLGELAAEVVGFQEVFHRKALEQALERVRGRSYPTVLCPAEDGENPSVALASRLEVLDHESIPDFPASARVQIQGLTLPFDRFRRPVLRATVALPDGRPLDLMVVHLKSKRPEIEEGEDPHDPEARARGKLRSLTRRAAEAVALRALILGRRRRIGHPLVLLGDLNDTGLAVTSEIVTGTPPWRSMDREEREMRRRMRLLDAWEAQSRPPPSVLHFSHIHNGAYECLDQVLVSNEFHPENPGRMGRVELVQVLNDHLVDDTLSTMKVPRWKSDHGQVVVTLRLRSRIAHGAEVKGKPED